MFDDGARAPELHARVKECVLGTRIARGAGVLLGLCGWTECGESANGQADRRVRVSFSEAGGGHDAWVEGDETVEGFEFAGTWADKL